MHVASYHPVLKAHSPAASPSLVGWTLNADMQVGFQVRHGGSLATLTMRSVAYIPTHLFGRKRNPLELPCSLARAWERPRALVGVSSGSFCISRVDLRKRWRRMRRKEEKMEEKVVWELCSINPIASSPWGTGRKVLSNAPG